MTVDVAKDLDRGLELKQRLLVLENFLGFLQQIIYDLLWQIYKWHILWILSLVIYNFIVEVVDDDIHDELLLVKHIGLGDLEKTLLELLAPYFLDVKRLGCVLLWLQVPIEEGLQPLAVGLLSESLLFNGRKVLPLALREDLVGSLSL